MIIGIKLELKWGNRIRSWSSWLKIITRLILWDYLHIYSVHGVCQRSVQNLVIYDLLS